MDIYLAEPRGFCAGVRRKHGPGGFHLQKELWPERGRDGAVCAHRGGDDG